MDATASNSLKECRRALWSTSMFCSRSSVEDVRQTSFWNGRTWQAKSTMSFKVPLSGLKLKSEMETGRKPMIVYPLLIIQYLLARFVFRNTTWIGYATNAELVKVVAVLSENSWRKPTNLNWRRCYRSRTPCCHWISKTSGGSTCRCCGSEKSS